MIGPILNQMSRPAPEPYLLYLWQEFSRLCAVIIFLKETGETNRARNLSRMAS